MTRPTDAYDAFDYAKPEEDEHGNIWPGVVMLRDTKLHDDMGGAGQRIYTTAGQGYKKVRYIRCDLVSLQSTSEACPKCGQTPPFKGGTRCQDLQCPMIPWAQSETPAIPQGWKLMPPEITQAMRQAIHDATQRGETWTTIYRAMLAAAP